MSENRLRDDRSIGEKLADMSEAEAELGRKFLKNEREKAAKRFFEADHPMSDTQAMILYKTAIATADVVNGALKREREIRERRNQDSENVWW
jgi:hypothetical protein